MEADIDVTVIPMYKNKSITPVPMKISLETNSPQSFQFLNCNGIDRLSHFEISLRYIFLVGILDLVAMKYKNNLCKVCNLDHDQTKVHIILK